MTAKPPVRLRGHHLICLQFFRGEGYSEEFVENLAHVVERAASEPALIVAGVDNVCAVCPKFGPDSRCASESAGGEAEIMRIDELALEVLGAAAGRADVACGSARTPRSERDRRRLMACKCLRWLRVGRAYARAAGTRCSRNAERAARASEA